MSLQIVKLDSCVNILSGFAFKSKYFNSNQEGMPLIRIRNVVKSKIETYYSGEYDDQYLIKKGDLLVGMDGDFNRQKWDNEPALLNQRVCKITPIATMMDSSYLYHLLPKELDLIHAVTPCVTVKHLSVQKIKDIELILPSLPEQQRIADILDKAEAINQKREQVLALCDEFLRATFLDMFGDPVSNPKGWEFKDFAELGELNRGKSKHRPRNDPKLLGGDYPLIQTGDVANSKGYITNFTSTYSEFGLKQSKLWSKGTLCITIAANIAKTGILTFDACFPDSVVGFEANDLVTIEYIQSWLGFLQKTLEDQAPESAQKNINLAILKALSIPTPPIELQQKFSSIVEKINGIKARIQDAQELPLFDALSQQAFKGELTQ